MRNGYLPLVVAFLFAIPSLALFLFHLSVSGIPDSELSGDHAAHFYKVFLASKGLWKDEYWYGINMFLVSPLFFVISRIVTLCVPSAPLAYKLIILLSDLLFIFLPFVAPWAGASIVFLQYMNVWHGVTTSAFALAFAILSVYFYVARGKPAIALPLAVSSVLFEPSLGGVFFIYLSAILLQRLYSGIAEKREIYSFLLSFGFIAAYYLAFVSVFHSAPPRLWKTSNYYTSPYFWAKFGLPSRALEEIAVFVFAILSSILLWRYQKRVLALALLFAVIYFVVGPLFPSLSRLPFASTHPFVYLSLLLLASGTYLRSVSDRISTFFSVASLFAFSLLMYSDIFHFFALEHPWNDPQLEAGAKNCASFLTVHPSVFIFSCHSGECGPEWSATAYFNAVYNLKTPQGWLIELMPAEFSRDISYLDSAISKGDVAGVSRILNKYDASLVMLGDYPHNAFSSLLVCHYSDFYLFFPNPAIAPTMSHSQ